MHNAKLLSNQILFIDLYIYFEFCFILEEEF